MLSGVIVNDSAVSKRIKVEFYCKIVGIDESFPIANKANFVASWIFFFSFVRSQWLMAKRVFNDGIG